MSPDLARLAEMAGLSAFYWNIAGERRDLTEETARALLGAMGFGVEDEEAIRESIRRFEAKAWNRLSPPVCVVREGGPATIPVVGNKEDLDQELRWTIACEDGGDFRGHVRFGDLLLADQATIEGRSMERRVLALHLPLNPGYHAFSIEGERASETRLIVAPPHCYLPPEIEEGRRLWGISAQLYAVRSRRNWGIGDYTDLADLAAFAARHGASTVVLNPFHALFPDHPETASPYFASSRLFLNPLYLDAARTPGFAGEPDHATLETARQADLVDYPLIARLKGEALRAAYAASSPSQEFEAFRSAAGPALRAFATYQSLSSQFMTPVWRDWPEDYAHPSAPAVKAFQEACEEEIGFLEWLEWQSASQLAEAATAAREAGMAIGLCRDLAVGSTIDGADGWMWQEVCVADARLGAPPDPLGPSGQEWGVSPLDPHALFEAAYQPFVDLLRANMRHAGALRIDHVMGIARQFWVPAGQSAANGAYVSYPFEDLLGILALESARNRCMIVGEDLGTVPEGFRERMADNRSLSCRVLYFEKDGDAFRAPSAYPILSAATVATHDLPTLRGFMDGEDLAQYRRLGLYPSEEIGRAIEEAREKDRPALAQALKACGLLPGDAEARFSEAFWEATHLFLARGASCLMLVQLDDLTEEGVQVNIPGTTDQRPNWRRKLRIDLEELKRDATAAARLDRIARERASPLRTD